MKIFHTLLALLIIAVSSGCSSKINMQPQIDEVNRIHHEQTFPNSGSLSWSVGQWALYRTTQSSREEVFQLFGSGPENGFRKISITGKSGNSFWLEQHIAWSDSEQHIAALVSDITNGENPRFKINRLKFTQNDGTIVEINEQDLASDTTEGPLDEMRYLINLLEHSHRSDRIRNITVPAGTFNNTKVIPFSMSLRFGKLEGDALYSYAVPVSTIVKLQTLHDTSKWFKDTSTWELADFGQTGASSHFHLTKE